MKAPRSSGRIPVRDPLKARPIGLRTASTMTASGIRKVSLVVWRRAGPRPARPGILRNEHEFSVRRVLLALPRLARPVERKRLALDRQLPARGQLDQPVVRRLCLVARHVSEGEPDDRERLATDVA